MKKVKTIFLFILIVAGFLLAACRGNRRIRKKSYAKLTVFS
ncbi:colicin release lysis protein [Klebsiella sp. 97147]